MEAIFIEIPNEIDEDVAFEKAYMIANQSINCWHEIILVDTRWEGAGKTFVFQVLRYSDELEALKALSAVELERSNIDEETKEKIQKYFFGTNRSGLLYLLSESGDYFLLYSTAHEELIIFDVVKMKVAKSFLMRKSNESKTNIDYYRMFYLAKSFFNFFTQAKGGKK